MCRFRAEITMANSKKKCRHCKAFALVETGITVPLGFYCTKEHALEHQQAKAIASVSKIRAKATQLAKKDIKARKQALKSLGELHKEAQPEFNKYIRLRDKGKPCISCQRHHTGQIHAGHYRSVGAAAELRYNENNVHAQCAPCNNHLSGNAIDYRINLINKIGIKAVEELEGPQEPKRYRRDDIIAIKSKYKALAKELTVKLEGAA
jgi:hypothetical protein